MKLSQLCKRAGLPYAGHDAEISAVAEDSRRVSPGALFVAVRGAAADGHEFIAQAAAAGAAAVIGDRAAPEGCPLPYLRSAEPRADAARIAHLLAGDPSKDLKVIGVTGTNGKGSVAWLVRAMLEHAGQPTANLGTIGHYIGDRVIPAKHTTPFGEELAELFREAVDAGMRNVVLEVSSLALEQGRTAGIDFDIAAFTNLTQDHLDHHGDMKTYRDAKLKLFRSLSPKKGIAVINTDDPHAEAFAAAFSGQQLSFGKGAQCRAVHIRNDKQSTPFELRTPWGDAPLALRLLGRHNVSNALCAAAIGGALGLNIEEIARGLEALPAIPGRFEAVDMGQNFRVVVDYAHTEDGLRNVLAAARALKPKRIITVFGCGGDRDTGKRPKMGAAAAALSDFSIVTSDNPRTEDPHRILLDIEMGMQHAGKKKGDDYIVAEDRRTAIRKAVAMAAKDDFVMIAGKGHEDYQILGTEKIHFDDREEARAALEAR